MKWLIGLIVLVLVAGGGYYAYKSMHQSAPITQPTATQSASPAANSAMQEITVSASEFAFTPSTITVKKGQEVKLTFKNNGQYPHNFTVSELGVATSTINPGEQTTITFTPDKTGSFTYICTVPDHADRGMKGTLTVE